MEPAYIPLKLTPQPTSAIPEIGDVASGKPIGFENQFPGADRWLEIGVRTNGGGSFFTLSPRQALTPAPYAITAGNLTGVVVSAGGAGTYSRLFAFCINSTTSAQYLDAPAWWPGRLGFRPQPLSRLTSLARCG